MAKPNDVMAIELFVESCERLYEFSRSLWGHDIFKKSKTSSSIRKYTTGWRLEVYVECQIIAGEEYDVNWCFELGYENESWVVVSGLCVGHSVIYIELPTRTASNISELAVALDQAVDELIASANEGSDFMREIRSLIESKN